MSVLGENASLITRFICKMRGGSQPVLAQASDGLVYVVKFTNNPQGANLPFNESMGSELYRACKLPVPAWKPLLVTDAFIDENPGCWMETADGYARPEPGLCFGSLFLMGDSDRMSEILSKSSLKRVNNSAEFWLAWLIDICAEHTDTRQAIFMEDRKGGLDAFFLDHGHLFGGPSGKERKHFTASRFLDLRIYQSVSPRYVKGFRDVVKNLKVDCIWQSVQTLPVDWRTGSAISALTRCLDRLGSALFLENIIATMVDAFQRKEQRLRDQCAPAWIAWKPPASVRYVDGQAGAQEQRLFAC